MSDAIDAWRELAKRLRGELSTAHMGVVGRYEGYAAEVHTCWAEIGKALYTELSVQSESPIRDECRLVWDGERYLGVIGALRAAAGPYR